MGHMKRREFITLLGGAAGVAACGKRAAGGKALSHRCAGDDAGRPDAANMEALRHGMRVLGYVEGRNLVIEYRSADGRGERFPDLAIDCFASRSTRS